jgi:hypothetical protein
MAHGKSSAERMRRLRERKRSGIVVVPHIQITRSGVEGLIAKGLLDGKAGSDPAEVRAAIVKLLNETLAPPPEPRPRQLGRHIEALRAVSLGLF